MEEQTLNHPGAGTASPFMSFDDIYKSPKRPASSFEEFWERKRSTSSTSEHHPSELSPGKKSNYFSTSSTPRRKISLQARLSSLSLTKLPRLSSLRLSDLGESQEEESPSEQNHSVAKRMSRKFFQRFSSQKQEE
jgi:hypothetical protein